MPLIFSKTQHWMYHSEAFLVWTGLCHMIPPWRSQARRLATDICEEKTVSRLLNGWPYYSHAVVCVWLYTVCFRFLIFVTNDNYCRWWFLVLEAEHPGPLFTTYGRSMRQLSWSYQKRWYVTRARFEFLLEISISHACLCAQLFGHVWVCVCTWTWNA